MKYKITFDGADEPLRDFSNVADLQQYSIAGVTGKYISKGDNLFLFYEIRGASFPISYQRYFIRTEGDLRIFRDSALPEVYFIITGGFHYSADGVGWVFIQATQFTVRYLPIKDVFSHLKKGEYSTFSIGIRFNFLGRLVKIYPELLVLLGKVQQKEPFGFPVNGVASPHMMEAVQVILTCTLAGGTRRYLLDAMVNSFLLQAIPILIQANRRAMGPEPESVRYKLSKVAQLIISNPEKKHKTTDLAQFAFMSVSSLAKEFKGQYGMPIHRFVIHQRMEKARMLIINTPASIKEIAETVGYKDTATFTHTFNKLYGFPPTALRQQ